MVYNTINTNNESDNPHKENRFIIISVHTPKGMNGIPEIANDIKELISKKYGRNVEAYLPKSESAIPVFEAAKEAFETAREEGYYVHSQMKANLVKLVQETKGRTWIPDLQALLDKYNNKIESFFPEGKPSFSINIKGHTYYMNSVRVEKQPFNPDGKGGRTICIGGETYLQYLYSIKFNPKNGSPELQDVLGTKEQYGKQADPRLINHLKAIFSRMGGWGIPSCGVESNPEDIFYDIKTLKMGLDGNTIQVLAPAMNQYDDSTLNHILAAKLSSINAAAQVLNIPSSQAHLM